jgi:hypothetical protein
VLKKIECFEWDYKDMSGLNRELVELKIPTYMGVRKSNPESKEDFSRV